VSLKNKINQELLEAQKAKDEIKVSTLRMVNASIKNEEIVARRDKKTEPFDPAQGLREGGEGEGAGLEDEKVLEVIAKEVKKRRESVEAYKKGGREELAEKEKKELEILEKYLPEQLSHDKIKEMVEEAVKQTGASGAGDFGKVMGVVMGKVKGQAGGAEVQRVVREALGS